MDLEWFLLAIHILLSVIYWGSFVLAFRKTETRGEKTAFVLVGALYWISFLLIPIFYLPGIIYLLGYSRKDAGSTTSEINPRAELLTKVAIIVGFGMFLLFLILPSLISG